MNNPTESPLNTKGITIEGLGVTFNAGQEGAVEALSPVDLQIQPGEFIALVGPSGCGKSTLLNVLAGFINPTTGKALVGDELITGRILIMAWCFRTTLCSRG
jgi:ABC-type sugar transport system ATPase subunit